MRAYKFRSASQIEFILDIIMNRRLYCSDWRKLNDPMEGVFAFSTRGELTRAQEIVMGVRIEKERYKICSLSSDFQSHLLWSHYAGGFDGVAIEVDIPENDPNIRPINYRGVFAFLDMDDIVDQQSAAQMVLFSKYHEWSYEGEIRILSRTEWYHLRRPITRVIAGQRMSEPLFRMLALVCEREGIEFCKVGIGDEGIDADPVDLARLTRRRTARRTRERQ